MIVSINILRINYNITPSLEKEIEHNLLHYSEFSGYKKFQKSSFFFPISQMHMHIENFIPSSKDPFFGMYHMFIHHKIP